MLKSVGIAITILLIASASFAQDSCESLFKKPTQETFGPDRVSVSLYEGKLAFPGRRSMVLLKTADLKEMGITPLPGAKYFGNLMKETNIFYVIEVPKNSFSEIYLIDQGPRASDPDTPNHLKMGFQFKHPVRIFSQDKTQRSEPEYVSNVQIDYNGNKIELDPAVHGAHEVHLGTFFLAFSGYYNRRINRLNPSYVNQHKLNMSPQEIEIFFNELAQRSTDRRGQDLFRRWDYNCTTNMCRVLFKSLGHHPHYSVSSILGMLNSLRAKNVVDTLRRELGDDFVGESENYLEDPKWK